jgi:two-component system, OmpR family, phosphate regulon response regulator PhoB
MPRILVVEPELDLSELIALALRAAGYEVVLAQTLGEAMALGWTPDLLIVSVGPDDDGPALCATALGAWPLTPLLALTSNPAAGAGRALLAAGANACLVFPFDPDALVAEVNRLLGRP